MWVIRRASRHPSIGGLVFYFADETEFTAVLEVSSGTMVRESYTESYDGVGSFLTGTLGLTHIIHLVELIVYYFILLS